MTKIATAAYPIDWLESWSQFEDKLSSWVYEATGAGSRLLVFPEYGAMELASLAGKEVAADLQGSLRAVADRIADVDQLHASLAQETGSYSGSVCPCLGQRRPPCKPKQVLCSKWRDGCARQADHDAL